MALWSAFEQFPVSALLRQEDAGLKHADEEENHVWRPQVPPEDSHFRTWRRYSYRSAGHHQCTCQIALNTNVAYSLEGGCYVFVAWPYAEDDIRVDKKSK
jgi:hypothetical protein